MEHFVLIINGWKPLTIVKKISTETSTLSLSIYRNVKLLSNVDKINTLTSKKNSNVMLKNYDVSSVL